MKNIIFIILFVGCTGAPHYKGPITDHFDGSTFKNRVAFTKTFLGYWWSRITSPRASWPQWIEAKSKKIPQEFLNKGQVTATFINHSTTLLNVDGTLILTDPIFAQRASPFTWAGPKRIRVPAVALKDLPKIDIIIISHNHYDHLDIKSIKTIYDRDQPLILSGLGNSLLFKENKILTATDLDWNQTHKFKGLNFKFLYCQHWSGRGLMDRRKTLWGSFLIESSIGKVYFSGDTGHSSHFEEQGIKYGPMDFSLIPFAAYEPRDFMKFSHMNPDEAVQAHIALKSKLTMGIHFGTFQLTNESLDQPSKDLKKAKEKYGVKEKMFFVPEFGKTYVIKNNLKEETL